MFICNFGFFGKSFGEVFWRLLSCSSGSFRSTCPTNFVKVFEQIFGQGLDQGFGKEKAVNTVDSTTRPRGNIITTNPDPGPRRCLLCLWFFFGFSLYLSRCPSRKNKENPSPGQNWHVSYSKCRLYIRIYKVFWGNRMEKAYDWTSDINAPQKNEDQWKSMNTNLNSMKINGYQWNSR